MTRFHYLILILLSFISIISSAYVEIPTKLGNVRGNVRRYIATDSPIYEYLGIQYGIAPIGDLRFRPCQLNESWSNTTYVATTFGAACIQNNAYGDVFKPQDENCLFLNIWTPTKSANDNLPTMVWIHGGGFVVGDSSSFEYNPINLIGKSGSNIIVVTINYRLGPLGFLSSKQLYDEDPNWKSYGGMNGIFDQIQALNWIHKYISDFGGDPNSVTIFGESAGGLSVCYLMISPMVPKGLFKRAIIESGSCIGPWGPRTKDVSIVYSNERLLSAGYTTNVTELRQVNATKLTLDVLGNDAGWLVAIDELVLDKMPVLSYMDLDRNTFNGDAMIIGFNSLDGVQSWPYFIGPHPNNQVELNEYLSLYIHNETQRSELENYYYPLEDFVQYNNNTNASIVWYTVNADVCVICPSLMQASYVGGNDKLKTFVYYFRGGTYPFYAPHGSELSFVFDHLNETQQYDVVWSQSLSNGMASAWSNYALYGVPDINDTSDDVNIEWKSFGSIENVMVFQDDNGITIQSQFFQDYRKDVCNFWYKQVGRETMTAICLNSKTPKKKANNMIDFG